MVAVKSIDRIIAESVDKDGAGGCWIWKQKLLSNGYGRVKHQGQSQTAHRFIYVHVKGPIPEGLQLDHICRNRACVNPDHLEPVTAAENQRRGTSPASENANRMHCIRGHRLSGENLFIRTNGSRRCQTCERNRQKLARKTDEYRARHAEQERNRRAKRKELKA